MPRHNPEITAFIPAVQLAKSLKDDYAQMCTDLGYKQAEMVRQMIRERVGEWKREKQAA